MDPTTSENLRVVYDQTLIGNISVSTRSRRKIVGLFTPCDGYDLCREAFAQASAWAKRLDDSHDCADGIDYLAFDCYIAAVQTITPKIHLPKVEQRVKEFAIDHMSRVEITLG